jgi:hypothetical protein
MRLLLALLISVLFSQAFATKSLHFNLPQESAELTTKLVEIVETVERHTSLEFEGEHNPIDSDFLIARNISLESYRYKSNHGSIKNYLRHFDQIHSTLPPPSLN